ncbi:MAG: radical SAM protein [Treponema sp.]|jgi:putative pyruvate formate lyase activating enzyme|nr:radical SAM protein [Treponema sp.]
MDISGLYKSCRLCPRLCGVDRLADAGGYCGESAQLRLAFAGLHRGEEPPLSGEGGSGTIFVSGCNLGCNLCQNWQISTGKAVGAHAGKRLGRAVGTDEWVSICLELQNRGAENINIVTGSHAVPAIAQGLSAAKTAGLRIPVLWNSSGYEIPETLEILNGFVDTYLPDLKTLDCDLAARFFNAPDYPQAASRAILWMLQQGRQRSCQVIIRHLILPGYLESTRAVLRWFADNAQGAALSLMTQYTPIVNAQNMPGRFLNKQEYDTVLDWLDEFGIEDGFCQELVTGSDWLPDFRRPNPFSSELSVAVWHC